MGRRRARARARRAHLHPPRAADPAAARPRDRGGSACRAPADRDRARIERGGRDRRRDRRAPRARPGFDIVVVDDGSRDRTAEVAAHTARGGLRSRSTSASAAPSRPASTMRARTGSSSRSRSTATASTSGRAAALLQPLLAGEADFVGRLALRRRHGDYRVPLARRLGIRLFARHDLAAHAPEGDRHDLRLPRAEPRGIELFAADYPHDYPEVEATVMVVQARLRLLEVPRRRCASACRPLVDHAARSVYYMIKVMLALFVGLFRRYTARRGAVTPFRISIVASHRLGAAPCSSCSS